MGIDSTHHEIKREFYCIEMKIMIEKLISKSVLYTKINRRKKSGYVLIKIYAEFAKVEL